MIYAFKRMVYKKGFFPGNPTPILAIGWTLVWGMWLVVTVVYSEVILGLFDFFGFLDWNLAHNLLSNQMVRMDLHPVKVVLKFHMMKSKIAQENWQL